MPLSFPGPRPSAHGSDHTDFATGPADISLDIHTSTSHDLTQARTSWFDMEGSGGRPGSISTIVRDFVKASASPVPTGRPHTPRAPAPAGARGDDPERIHPLSSRNSDGLLRLARALLAEDTLDGLLDALVKGATTLLECDAGYAGALSGECFETRRYHRAGRVLPMSRRWKAGEGLPGWVLDRDAAYLTNEAESDLQIEPEVRDRFGVRSALALPLRTPDGVPMGVLVLHNRRGPGGFSPADLSLLREIGTDAALALRNVRRLDAFERERSAESDANRLHTDRLKTVGRLAGGIAHDFNNFLTVILGETDLLLHRTTGEARFLEVEEIRKAALRARFLTNRLLDYSRREPASAASLDATASVREMASMLRRLVGVDIEVRDELSEGLPPITIGSCELDQIIMNLAVNARDAMPCGGTLTFRTSRTGAGSGPEGVQIEVSDTGEGMTEAVRARVFDPYFTTKAPGHGTGLGLSTVARIVRSAGGHVSVQSERGRGTTFRIILPTAGGAGAADAPDAGGNGDGSPARRTVLLVEDDGAVRGLIKRILEREGMTVLEAGTGAEALEIAEAQGESIDLLLLDVMLPDMGGIQLRQLLTRRLPGRRTILMSGHLKDELPAASFEQGTIEFLPKPFAVRDLVELVGRVLRGS